LFPSHLGTGQAKIHVHLSTFLRDEIVASSDKERLQWLQRLQWSSYYTIKADIFCQRILLAIPTNTAPPSFSCLPTYDHFRKESPLPIFAKGAISNGIQLAAAPSISVELDNLLLTASMVWQDKLLPHHGMFTLISMAPSFSQLLR
jgi:hypothetical protein